MMKKPSGFADLASLPEDDRIDIIGRTVVEQGKTVAVCIDDQPAKVERYIRKMKERFPTAVVLDQRKGPVAGVVTVKFGPQ
jgi:hypothetical protein